MERGELRAALAILLVWVNGSLAAPVPSLYHGFWDGNALSARRSHAVRIGIVGGANKDTIGFVHARKLGGDSVCVHHLQLTAKSGKKSRKDRDAFEGKTRSHSFSSSPDSCSKGVFRFEPLNVDRIFVSWTQLNSDGDPYDNYEMIMDRMDDGRLRKTLDGCSSKAANSPASRLRDTPTCKEKAPELPSRFLGLWGGLILANNGRRGVTAIITGGSINSTVALLYSTAFSSGCGHQAILSAGGGEQNNEDAYEIRTSENFLGDCYGAEIRLTPIQSNKNKILIDWTYTNQDTGKVLGEFPPTTLDRYDSRRLTKTIDKCTPSEGDVLRTQLFCKEKDEKGKKKVKGGARGRKNGKMG